MAGIVVVGAGLAGLRGAETLRRLGYDGELTLVGDEAHRPYNRPMLSKEFLRGAVPEDSCYLDTSALDATWLLGQAATGLDPGRGRVVLADGEALPYDRLLIATGCRSRPWPARVGLEGVHQLRTLDEARELRLAASRSERVAIIGAGFVGCEVAATLRGLGLEVVLLDVADRPMTPLGPEVSHRARTWHEQAGVELLLGVEVAEFVGEQRVSGVRLADGRVIAADLVVVGIGAVPNTEWLAGAGLELVDGAVRSDRYCLAAGFPDIGVAGDVAAWPDPVTNAVTRVEHWTNAVETAITAAHNLLRPDAERIVHRPVPTFWSDQYDYQVRAAGTVPADASTTVIEDDPRSGRLIVEFHRGDALTGAVTVNSRREHLSYRRRLAARS